MNRLRLIRYERGHKLTEVASAVGVTRQTLSRLERGESLRPNAATAKALADYYGISVADLLGVPEKDAA